MRGHTFGTRGHTGMTVQFGAESTTDEVLDGIDLSGKRVLVTGVSAGLGVETARALVAHGAHVVGAARNLAKAEAATAPVREAAAESSGSFELVELDLASLASVRACADALNAAGQTFDIVIANAGIMATPFAKTADGFESQFGTNHLGHFALTARLQAYSDSACTSPYGPPAAAAVSVTADAGMVPKLPAAAVASSIVNPGTVTAAATGQSRVRFKLDSTKFDFSAAPGASAASVTVMF